MLLSAGLGRRRAVRRWQPSGSSSPSEPSLASDARTLAPKLLNSIGGPVEPTGPASVGPAPRRPELADRERRSEAERRCARRATRICGSRQRLSDSRWFPRRFSRGSSGLAGPGGRPRRLRSPFDRCTASVRPMSPAALQSGYSASSCSAQTGLTALRDGGTIDDLSGLGTGCSHRTRSGRVLSAACGCGCPPVAERHT